MDQPIFKENERFLVEHFVSKEQIVQDSKEVVNYFKQLLTKEVQSVNIPKPLDNQGYIPMLLEISMLTSQISENDQQAKAQKLILCEQIKTNPALID